MDDATMYDEAKARIVALVTDGTADIYAAVDACPGWTVKDLVAHLAGGLGDFVARRFDGVESGEWGERNVSERRDRSLADHLVEWEANRVAAAPLFDSPTSGVLLAEIISHEHDIRTALNRPGARDEEAVRAASVRPLQELDRRMREAGSPALRIVVDGSERVVGDGEPAGTLTVSAFELLRTIGGRRSPDQVQSVDWDGDPFPWLDTFSLFGGRTSDLVE